MDIEKIKKMDKARVLYELDRLSRLTKTLDKPITKVKEKKKIDYNIFEKPKSKKREEIFSKSFLTELKTYITDSDTKKSLIKMIKNKNDSDDTSSDEED